MSSGDQNRIAPHPVLQDYYNKEEERRKRVDNMFDSSAEHYDWVTDVMSFGSGRWYRRQALQRAGLTSGDNVLDVGAGTGVVSWLAQQIVGDEGRETIVGGTQSGDRLSEIERTVRIVSAARLEPEEAVVFLLDSRSILGA